MPKLPGLPPHGPPGVISGVDSSSAWTPIVPYPLPGWMTSSSPPDLCPLSPSETVGSSTMDHRCFGVANEPGKLKDKVQIVGSAF